MKDAAGAADEESDNEETGAAKAKEKPKRAQPERKLNAVDALRCWVLDQLYAVAKNPLLANSSEGQVRICAVLLFALPVV